MESYQLPKSLEALSLAEARAEAEAIMRAPDIQSHSIPPYEVEIPVAFQLKMMVPIDSIDRLVYKQGQWLFNVTTAYGSRWITKGLDGWVEVSDVELPA